jgi:ABC-type multidrug transport system ATPase subunit
MITRGLRVGYQGRVVCDVPDLTLTPGRVWLVTGPNGSGKTTLLKTLAGLLAPVAGSIEPPPLAGRGGVVFVHSSPVVFRGTLRHNLRLATADMSAIERAAADFGLTDRLDQSARDLSHGMRQRAALARAALAQSSVLLLDEPEGGLDESAVAMFQTFAAQIVNAARMTLVVAAHRTGLLQLPLTDIQLTTSATNN